VAWHRRSNAYVDRMRPIAIVTMMFAWLVYGTMSAWAGCPMCASMNQIASVGNGVAAQHDMAGMDMGAASAAPEKDPCAAGGMVHMPFCSACLVVPPVVAIHAGGRQVFSYPSPASAETFPGARPAPLAPPPRLI
jgi:outer membrane murein-binding lipoprotein Lpp